MMLRLANVEMVAEAVDDVTEREGLTRGEALYVFTSMLITTLEDADPVALVALRDAVIESLKANTIQPLATCLLNARKPS